MEAIFPAREEAGANRKGSRRRAPAPSPVQPPKPCSILLRIVGCWGLLLLPGTAGCVMTEGFRLSWACADLPPQGEVSQVLALWGEGIVVQPDPMRHGVPSPGLAARIYLVGRDLGRPLAGDGSLSVYLYDAAQQLSDEAVPQEVWNIDPANLQRVLTRDGLGWGYDLWLPWRTYRPGVSQVRLVVKYQSPQGAVAWSSSTDYAVRAPGAGKPLSVVHTTVLPPARAGEPPSQPAAPGPAAAAPTPYRGGPTGPNPLLKP